MGKGKCTTMAILFKATMLGCLLRLYITVEATSSHSDIDPTLKLLNKPAVKTIKSEDGDIIDCVDIYKQPAFDHPLLKNHKIQMAPSFIPEARDLSISTKSTIPQIWHRSGSCPNGTIPIRRIQKNGLFRARYNSLKKFGTKPPLYSNTSRFVKQFNTTKLTLPILEGRSAAVLATVGYNFIGAQADFNIWNPSVDLPDDFTTAQMWLKADDGGPTFESVEAGWAVNPKLYGDRKTRLFAYWTKDSYGSTGCFDLTCPGFVQTGTQFALGGALEPYSSKNGSQYQANFGIFWDNSTGNWWLKVAHNIPIGYWPASLFGSLSHSAIIVEWGGEVFSSNMKKTPHTATAMGSGVAASGRFGNAAYVKNIRIMDYSLSLKYPEIVDESSSEPNCYSTLNDKTEQEPVFYYGGPGRNPPQCP